MIVDITRGIKVGGFDFTIDLSKETQRRILSNGNAGECDTRNHRGKHGKES